MKIEQNVCEQRTIAIAPNITILDSFMVLELHYVIAQ